MAEFLNPKVTTGALKRYPFSLLVKAGGFAFLAGQGPVDLETGAVVPGDVGTQTDLTMSNIRRVLEASGLSLAHIVKATVYLADIDDFGAMSEAYEAHFDGPLPARTTLGAGALWGGIRVEIEVVAVLELTS